MEWLAIGALAATVIGLIGKFTNWTFRASNATNIGSV